VLYLAVARFAVLFLAVARFAVLFLAVARFAVLFLAAGILLLLGARAQTASKAHPALRYSVEPR